MARLIFVQLQSSLARYAQQVACGLLGQVWSDNPNGRSYGAAGLAASLDYVYWEQGRVFWKTRTIVFD